VVRLLADACRARRESVTVVKIVQTGVDAEDAGDARVAVERNGQTAIELLRFAKPADPWTASIAEGRAAPAAADLVRRVEKIDGNLLVEGSGGALVPINAEETISTVAERCGLRAVVVVGLRLGCISHALLTQHYLSGRGMPVCGFVLVDRWSTGAEYEREVENVLLSRGCVLGTVPYVEQGDPPPAVGAELLRAIAERSR
jgi:dethiobiotin synthase